ncbi:MAG: hypothetical protein ACE5Q6_06145, partial [Dehalococcoidia bacterium]
ITFQVRPSMRYADDAATGAVSFDVPDRVTVEGSADAVFVVRINIFGDRLRDNLMNSGALGNNPAPLTSNEYDGFLALESADHAIHLPWHVLPRKAARVQAASSRAGLGSAPPGAIRSVPLTNTIELSNSGVGSAQNQAYSLLAVSPNLPRGGRGEESPSPDLRAVGVQTFEVPPGFCSPRPSYIMAFAVTTWEQQTHANWPGIYRIDLDTDQNGAADFMVFNTDAGFMRGTNQGRNMTWVMDLTTGGASAFFFTEHATNSANTVLYLCGEQIGSPAVHQEINATVAALDVYFGGPGDMVEGVRFSPRGERSLTEPLPDVPAGEEDFVTVSGPNTFLNDEPGLGILVFTNSDRGPFSRGGATADTEALVLLNQTAWGSVSGPSREVAKGSRSGAGYGPVSRE